MALAPGESSELHRHLDDYVFAYLTPTVLESREPGHEPQTRIFEEGFVQFTVVGKNGRTHQVRNAGDLPHRQIIVELLGGSASEEHLPPETNGRVSDARPMEPGPGES
jgi:hypothetical protein